MKLTCILRAAVGHTVHELAEAPAEGSQSCSWRPGLATKTRDQEGAQERPRRGVVAQRASNFLSLRIRSITVFDSHRVLCCLRVCDKLLLEYITEMHVQMRGHSERSRNAFRAEPFRTFRYPWQPRREAEKEEEQEGFVAVLAPWCCGVQCAGRSRLRRLGDKFGKPLFFQRYLSISALFCLFCRGTAK